MFKCPYCGSEIDEVDYYDWIDRTEDENTISKTFYYTCNACARDFHVKEWYETKMTEREIIVEEEP